MCLENEASRKHYCPNTPEDYVPLSEFEPPAITCECCEECTQACQLECDNRK